MVFVVSVLAIFALYLAARIGAAIGRRSPAPVSLFLAASAAVAAVYWLFVWELHAGEGAAGGVVIFVVFAKAFGVVCLVAAGALLYGSATRDTSPPDA
ncbi:hypothetical protein ISP17_05080 [Dyella ginsengisoli]|uniref:Uncharacterized protein n=1 Tax=Dyella ginsengisoli TaxID=363848 RepID=A0ABW8JSY2_9GAMM